MYKGDAVEKIIEKSKGLNRREVMHALGITQMTYMYPKNLRHRGMFISDEDHLSTVGSSIYPIEMVKQTLNVDDVLAAQLLNITFKLGVKDDIKPSEYERMAAEEAEAIRRKNEAFFSENIELLDWANTCLNEKKPSSEVQDTWPYKSLEAMGKNIDVLREKLEKREWIEDERERERIADGMTTFKNIRAALEAAQ